MKYAEIKEYLKTNPYCFQTTREKADEFNQKISSSAGKDIIFNETSRKSKTDYE